MSISPKLRATIPIESPLPWSDFLLHEQIGTGATGRVYRATWRSRDQEVAVKFLRKSLIRQPAVVERFLREAQTVARLADPGIVAMHGAGRTAGGGYFLVLELVRGRDLDRIARDQPIDSRQAARWVAQAARIVHRAHELGVIHCDLKPGNLLFDGACQIRVTDFGLAVRLTDGASRSGLLAGTPAFMAPEQVDPTWGEISPRTDVYGLGAVLYFLLCNRPPYTGETMAEVLSQVAGTAPVELPPNLACESILRRCLARSPADRFASALELALALESLRNATESAGQRVGRTAT
jgi:serine/threonine protein kinase